jgi:hypothetical protein
MPKLDPTPYNWGEKRERFERWKNITKGVSLIDVEGYWA